MGRTALILQKPYYDWSTTLNPTLFVSPDCNIYVTKKAFNNTEGIVRGLVVNVLGAVRREFDETN